MPQIIAVKHWFLWERRLAATVRGPPPLSWPARRARVASPGRAETAPQQLVPDWTNT